MAREKNGLKRFEAWVDRFIRHVEQKGPMPDIEEDERNARTTTNVDR